MHYSSIQENGYNKRYLFNMHPRLKTGYIIIAIYKQTDRQTGAWAVMSTTMMYEHASYTITLYCYSSTIMFCDTSFVHLFDWPILQP